MLPAGYDSWEHNGDEINGAGANEPVWPDLFDTFEGLSVLVLSSVMLDAFNDCPDIVMGEARNVLTIPIGPRTLLVEEVG